MIDDAPTDDLSTAPKILEWVLDRWMQVLGITFLLLGVGFLFKYSYDHGMFIPPLRVLCGFGVGGVLAYFGWKIRDERRRLAQILTGGASATFYITCYAASELYGLVGAPVAFAGMLAVTMATFVVATTQRDAVLANVAAIGAFAAPFLLDVPSLLPAGFQDLGTIIYMCLVLAGTTAIYLFRGWTTLLTVSAALVWSYLALAVAGASTVMESTFVQVAVVFAWLATGVAPAVRAHLEEADDTPALALAFLVPGFAMLLSRFLWEFPNPIWGVVGLLVAALYTGATLFFRRSNPRSALTTTHGLLALGFATFALTDLLSGASLMTALLAEAVALCWLDSRDSEKRVFFAGQGALGLIGHLLLLFVFTDSVRLLLFASDPGAIPFLGPVGLQLLGTSAALVGVARFHEPEAVRPGIEWVAHLFLLTTVLHQSALVEHGDLVCTAIWGAYAIGLLSSALVARHGARQWMGVTALLLAAGKLLIVDMQGAETLWRVLLFMGFGAALLALSYFAPRWGKSAPDEPQGPEDLIAEAA